MAVLHLIHTTSGGPLEVLKQLCTCRVPEQDSLLTKSQPRFHLPITYLQPSAFVDSISQHQCYWRVTMLSLIYMGLGLDNTTQDHIILTSNIVLLLVWPSLTVKNSIKATRTYMPWRCLHLVKSSKTSLSLRNSNTWAPTDVTTSFTLSRQSHVIIMYQYSGYSGSCHIVMRLSIDSVSQQHTASLTGDTAYTGNFGLWQGSLNAGQHKVSLNYRSPAKTTYTASGDPECNNYNKWMNRAITITCCWRIAQFLLHIHTLYILYMYVWYTLSHINIVHYMQLMLWLLLFGKQKCLYNWV